MKLSENQEREINFLLFITRLLMGFGINLYVPSLPAIALYFHASIPLVQSGIAFYMLGYGIGQLLLGILSDSFGRRKIFLLSAFLFTLASLFVLIYTPTIQVLNGYRFLQGLAISGLGTLCRAIASDCYSGIALNKAMVLITTSYALGPIIGPFIGSYFQHYYSWTLDFYFFGLFGIIILCITFFKLPETSQYLQPLNIKNILTTTLRIFFILFFFFKALWSLSFFRLLLFLV